MPENIDRIPRPFGQHIVDDIDADVFVAQQRPRRTQKKNDREQDPLQLKPGIRTGVEYLSNDGIAGGKQHGCQKRPGEYFTQPQIDRIDDAAEGK